MGFRAHGIGRFILLDDALNSTPFWRLAADGSGEPEIVVEDGYPIDVIPGTN